MNLVVNKARGLAVKIPLVVSILNKGRCSWIEIIGVFPPGFIPVEISGRFGRNSGVIVLVNVFVKNLKAVVDIEAKSEQCIDRIFVLICCIFSLIPQDVIPISEPD